MGKGWRASLCLLLWVATAVGAEPERLTLYTWTDYIDPAVVTRFEQATGSQLDLQTFEEADEREEVLAATNARGFDLVCISENYLTQAGLQDWMEPLDRDRLPNLRHLHYPMNAAIPLAPRYAVPYFWGTFGIAYRKDLIPEVPRSWKDLFDLTPKYSGKVAMYPTVRMLAGMALLAAGADFNSQRDEDIEAAGAILLRQAHHVWGYRGADLSENSLLASGKVVMQSLFNGDALFLRRYQPNIEFVYPAEGSNVFVDYFVIPRNAEHKALAYQFLDFINQPAVALQNALYVKFATPNDAARQLAPADYRQDSVIFPSPDVIDRGHIILPLPPAVLRQYTDIVMRATTQYEMLNSAE